MEMEDFSNEISKANDSEDANMEVSAEEEARQAIEMLRGDDVSERIAAANKIEIVAKTLGDERTREELLPFLTEGVDDEDEVLAVIAISLGKLVPYVGGAQHIHTLLTPIEILLSVEETTVRENAQISAGQISAALPSDQYHSKFVSMISRLAKKEWFTARISACHLIASSFEKLKPAEQEEHVAYFASLCRDEVPMVRRAAAQKLGTMVEKVVSTSGSYSVGVDGMITTTFVQLYEHLASNEQPDSVRLHTTENCISFGKSMEAIIKSGKGDRMTKDAINVVVNRIIPLIVASTEDRSWRVRWTAASKFALVISAFSSMRETMDLLVPAYEKLLQDPEAEVKAAATLNMAKVAESECDVPALSVTRGKQHEDSPTKQQRISIARRLVKKIGILSEDDNENVRAALAMVATDLAPLLGKEITISDLVPQVLMLLRDSTSEVRLNVISSLGSLNKVIGVDLLSQSLLPAILDLANDSKWRIRLAIMNHIPLLAKELGKRFFNDDLIRLCVSWLGDSISSIRVAAAENLKELTSIFGSDWIIDNIFPPLSEIRQHQSYLRRVTAVQAYTSIATVMDGEISKIECIPLILMMATDSVANIRFKVAQSLEILAPFCDETIITTQFRPVLSMLADDPDRDVRFFTEKTLRSLNS
jgi:serine/threonine-protein phosphatase 2A regulatory subunit A